jgi:hypothetical protein
MLRALGLRSYTCDDTSEWTYIREMDGQQQVRHITLSRGKIHERWTAGSDLVSEETSRMVLSRLAAWVTDRHAELIRAGWHLSAARTGAFQSRSTCRRESEHTPPQHERQEAPPALA